MLAIRGFKYSCSQDSPEQLLLSDMLHYRPYKQIFNTKYRETEEHDAAEHQSYKIGLS